MSEDKVIEAGGLEFRIAYRRFGGDRGPAIHVFGDVDGRPVQVLRFDCFEKTPHYHYDPSGMDGYHLLDRAVVPDVVAWSLVQIRDNIAAMVKTAGYPGLAEKIDRNAIAEKIDALRQAVEEVEEEATS